jgi:sugar phosphate isomerase/epimerase
LDVPTWTDEDKLVPLLSLAHFTVIDADPIGLIEAGQAGGYDAIGLRIVAPFQSDPIVPVVGDPNMIRSVKRRLADTGLKVLDVEAVWLSAESDVASLEPALDVAVELGAKHVIVAGNDHDRGRLSENLSRLCAAADLRGVRVMLEFLPYSQIRSLAEAVAMLADVGPANAGVLVDALHLSRSGGSPADLAQYDPGLFTYMHLCDAAAIPPAPEGVRSESRGGRLYPGEGGLWLADFIRAFPQDTPIAIEAPSADRAGLSPAARASLAAAGARRLLKELFAT